MSVNLNDQWALEDKLNHFIEAISEAIAEPKDSTFVTFEYKGTKFKVLNEKARLKKLLADVKKPANGFKHQRDTQFCKPRSNALSLAPAVNAFIKDGEEANAYHLMKAKGKKPLFCTGKKGPFMPEYAKLLSDDRFFICRLGKASFSVTHIDSGLSAGKGFTRPAALETFEANRKRSSFNDKIAKATKEHGPYEAIERRFLDKVSKHA